MQLPNDALNASAGFLAVVAVLWTLITSILWLSIGWRAMRAHERIADVLNQRAKGS